MLKQISDTQRRRIDSILSAMTVEEKIGQVQCLNCGPMPEEEILRNIAENHIGAIYLGNVDYERVLQVSRLAERSEVPIIRNGDLVAGAGSRIKGLTEFPQYLACSAANDEGLIRRMGEITAEEGRAVGFHWTFGPVLDLCLNPQNPMMHIRTAGDDPERVLRIGRAFVEGVQGTGYFAATGKHFPGDGVDSRDTHITTLINSLDPETWEKSYGRIWRGIISAGVMAVMSGHIALPFLDPEYDDPSMRYKGPPPASVSRKILLDFLRGELGFDGLIVTDAVNMIGLGAHLRREVYAPVLLKAGNDLLLWTKPYIDNQAILDALDSGDLSVERLDDAVRRNLELKARVGLLDAPRREVPLSQDGLAAHRRVAQEVADRSVTVLRDVYHSVPCGDLLPGSKVLTITLTFVEGVRNERDGKPLGAVDDALRARGFVVDHLENPGEGVNLGTLADAYDRVFVNFKYPAKFGTVRLMGDAIAGMKGSWWVENPKVIFTAFGDPFKIYDLPSLHSYIATYSVREVSQIAAVKVWLGELPPAGDCPVNMKRFLNFEVN